MLKLNSRHYHKSFLSLGLIFVATLFTYLSSNINPVSGQIIAEQSTGFVNSIWRRRPKKPLGSRCIICPISPGIIDTYIVWNNRPLFLWNYSGKNEQVDLIVREFESKKEVWKQTVNLADKKTFYNGQEPLEAGKIYQWLLGNNSLGVFKIMPTDERVNIDKKLQALEQQLKNSKASPEEIALKKADFFLNYEIKNQAENKTFNAWSDALLVLYQVENPSPGFVKNREEFVQSVYTQISSTSKKIR